MHISFLLLISCSACHLAAAAPQYRIRTLYNIGDLERSDRDPELIKFIHKLLHCLQNDYQDPNWPKNLQSRMQPILSDDYSEEESHGVVNECNGDTKYNVESKKLRRGDVSVGHHDYTDHKCGEVCFCDSYELQPGKPATKPKQAIIKPTEKNIVYTDSLNPAPSPENHYPKLLTNLQDAHPITTKMRSEERRALQDSVHNRLSSFHILPRIQINQFGTNKVEQNLHHQLDQNLGYMNKNQREESEKNSKGYTESRQPHKVGSKKFSTYDDKDEEQRDNEVGNTKRTWPILSDKSTKNKFFSNQGSSQTSEYRNIKYNDIDINIEHNKHNQEIIPNLPKVTDQHKSPNYAKVFDIYKGSNKLKILDLSKDLDQPKVPDQPKIIIDDITEATTEDPTNCDDLTTATDLMDKEPTRMSQNVTPAIYMTTEPSPGDVSKPHSEDAMCQSSKTTQSIAKNKTRRSRARSVTATTDAPRDQEAEGNLYYPLSWNEGDYVNRPQNFINAEAPHGVPIAYESNPRGSAPHFQTNYYNSGISRPLQNIARNPLFRAFKDRFTTMQHDPDYDSYDDYGTQVSNHPTQYRLNAPAATVYWNSIHKPRYGKSVRSSLETSYRFAKLPRFEEPQSLHEHDDFDDDPELGWEDWEPSYNNDMLLDRSYLRPASRELYNQYRYFI